MPEFKDTVIWLNETQSDFYLSFYNHSADNPLADLNVKKINTLVTYNSETGDYGPCYSSNLDKLGQGEDLLIGPFRIFLNQPLYNALQNLNNSALKLAEFDLQLENGICVSNLIPDDLLVTNSNPQMNTLLLRHELDIKEIPKMDPYRIYQFDRKSGTLEKTNHHTKDIIDFVICNPHLFFEIPDNL